jgi:oligopeptide/dipeptide ABC transporter ATP-binding protein
MVEMPDAKTRFRQYPHECSGGMRQRAMIAMALANEPTVLICDEPTTALDVTVQAQVLELIKRLQVELGMSVILVTHDLGVINAVTDDVHVMYAGKLVETGTTTKIMTDALHPYTDALLHAMPDLENSHGELQSIPGVPPALTQIFDWCPFGPRCPRHSEECDKKMPDLVARDNEQVDAEVHRVACVHPLDVKVAEVVRS